MTQRNVGLILLAGGQGVRFGGAVPKQYMMLKGKPLAVHAFHLFQECFEIAEIVVVCAEDYRQLFLEEATRPVKFALPGSRRQDSVENGFKALSDTVELVCIHDAARPFPTKQMVSDVLDAAEIHGASAVGMPIKYTLKDCDGQGIVVETPDRSRFWEIQTPQALRCPILKEGLAVARQEGVTVTDDTSLAELVGSKVKVVNGSYRNIKVTTPDDLAIAEQLHVHL